MSLKEQLSIAIKHPVYTLDRLSSKSRVHVEDILDYLKLSSSKQEAVTGHEYLVSGLRRSGNHAVINWIESQCSGNGCYLNNLRLGENPYRYIYSLLNSTPSKRDKFIVDEFNKQSFYQGVSGRDRLRLDAFGIGSKKDYLIHSYEDYSIKKLTKELSDNRRLRFFGESQKKFDVLILRDPFNLMASRYHSGRFDLQGWETNILDIWLEHAREYLGETQYLGHRVCVNYNQWSADQSYRRRLSDQLSLNFTDGGFDSVPSFGGGSSFDRELYNGSASKMKTEDRWKRFSDDETFRGYFTDRQVLVYASKIFPDLDKHVEVLFG